MGVEMPPGRTARVIDGVVLAPVGIDQWSDIRDIHRAAAEKLIAGYLEPEEISAFRDLVDAAEYSEQMAAENPVAAWLDGYMIGTCGWRPADDAGTSARLTSLFVHPLFIRLGVGRKLVLDTEARARAAGFHQFSVRTTANAIGFFEHLGYEVSSYGVYAVSSERDVPIAFMRKRDDASLPHEPDTSRRSAEDEPALSRDER